MKGSLRLSPRVESVPVKPRATDRRTEFRRLALLIAIYAIPAVAAVGPVPDPDVWWHLRTGQWMIEHGGVPTTDPFSAFTMGKPWVAYSWLFDLLIYGLYRAFGLTGLVVYTAAMLLLIAVALHALVRRCAIPFFEEVGLLGLALCGLLPLVSPRPWLFTILFFVVELNVILTARGSGRTRPLWLLPPLFALWANLHIEFVYGLLILGLAGVEPIVARLFHAGRDETGLPTRSWALVLIACVAATLATPYHVFQYREIAAYVTQSGGFSYIAELHPLAINSIGNWAVLAMTLTCVFLMGRSRDVSVLETFLLLTGVGLSFRSSRDAWVVDVLSLGIIATIRAHRVDGPDRFPLTSGRTAVVACATIAVVVISGLNRKVSQRGLSAALAEHYPVAAAAVIDERGYGGPLYNHFDWGGYLIWRLPRLPVSIDGRALLYGGARIQQQMKTWAGEPEWKNDPDLSKARLVILQARLPLTSLLRVDPRFDVAYEDHVAVVFVVRGALGRK